MSFHIKYFGMLAEATGQAEETWALDHAVTVGEFRRLITEKYPQMREKKFKIAVNQRIAEDYLPIEPAAEIALLPPFAGG